MSVQECNQSRVLYEKFDRAWISEKVRAEARGFKPTWWTLVRALCRAHGKVRCSDRTEMSN